MCDVNFPAKVKTNIPPKVKIVLHLLTLILTSANSKNFQIIKSSSEIGISVSPPHIRASLLQLKSGLIRGMASLEGENVVVFHSQFI